MSRAESGLGRLPHYQVGRVVERDPATCRVKVAFDAADAVTSWWLPVIQGKTHADQVYWLPDVDEHVVCLLDEYWEHGVVLGAIYSASDSPPVTGVDLWHVRFKDGTSIEYDRAAHQLRIDVRGASADVVVTAERNVRVEAGGDVSLEVTAGKHVFIGGAGGRRLATEDFVSQVYLQHKHPCPDGETGPPVATGTETEWPQVTDKGVSE